MGTLNFTIFFPNFTIIKFSLPFKFVYIFLDYILGFLLTTTNNPPVLSKNQTNIYGFPNKNISDQPAFYVWHKKSRCVFTAAFQFSHIILLLSGKPS